MLSKVVVTLSPAVTDREGYKQLVCKHYPAVLDFLLLGFAPRNLKRHFATRLAHDEIQGLHEQAPSTDIPIITGCFMLFRTAALRSVGASTSATFSISKTSICPCACTSKTVLPTCPRCP
jgi:hypothetical protein